jgi:hypothetical protein
MGKLILQNLNAPSRRGSRRETAGWRASAKWRPGAWHFPFIGNIFGNALRVASGEHQEGIFT